MTWRLNTSLTQSSQWGWVELIWRLEPGNYNLTRWVSFGSGVQRPGNLPSTPPASTNIFPGGEKSALTRIRVRQSQAGSDTGLTRAKGSQTKDEPVLKQGGGGGDGDQGPRCQRQQSPVCPFVHKQNGARCAGRSLSLGTVWQILSSVTPSPRPLRPPKPQLHGDRHNSDLHRSQSSWGWPAPGRAPPNSDTSK